MLDLKSRLSRSYLYSSPNPSFAKGGACCKPMVCPPSVSGCWGDCLCRKIEMGEAVGCSSATILKVMLRYARYLRHSIQKSRVASFLIWCYAKRGCYSYDCLWERLSTLLASEVVLSLLVGLTLCVTEDNRASRAQNRLAYYAEAPPIKAENRLL